MLLHVPGTGAASVRLVLYVDQLTMVRSSSCDDLIRLRAWTDKLAAYSLTPTARCPPATSRPTDRA